MFDIQKWKKNYLLSENFVCFSTDESFVQFRNISVWEKSNGRNFAIWFINHQYKYEAGRFVICYLPVSDNYINESAKYISKDRK